MSLSSNFPAIKPSLNLDFANTKRLDPRVTFTRSTTGTYYDGVTTAKAEENLLFYSQQFNFSPWATGNFTVTADATTAPDGTTTAESFVPDTTSTANHQLSQSFTVAANAPYVFSIFVKPFGYTKIAFRESVQTGAYATFDLSGSGSVVSTGNVAFVFITNAAITSVAGGWFRINLTVTSSNAVSLGMAVFALNNTYTSGDPYSASVATGNGTDGVYIWGAQLEQRSTATAYTATTTQPITNYIPVLLTAAANVPRFDHNPTTDESLGLLIEEQRTNLALYSEQFDNGYWIKGSSSVTANMVASPDGTVNADGLISAASGSGASGVFTTISGLSGGATYTMSCYIKSKGANWTQLIAVGTGGSQSVTRGWFNISTGVVGTINNTSSAGTIQNAGNGWYRCSMIVPALTTTAPTIYFACANGDGIDAFTNDGWSGLYLWGAQLEVGSFATSYIATTSAAVTRTADVASMTGANFTSWFNNQEGTIYYSGVLNGRRTSGFENVAIFTNGTATTNSFGVGTEVSGNDLRAFVLAGGTLQADLRDGAPQVGTQFKGAFAYQANDFSFCADNGTVQTDSSGLVPSGIDRVTFGVEPAGGSPYNGTINKVAYYPQRITDAQVKALTS